LHGWRIRAFAARPGSGLHDVACNADGTVWITGQRDGTLNLLDPRDGGLKALSLGTGAAPHGVVVGPDGAAWVAEGGQNAIARATGTPRIGEPPTLQQGARRVWSDSQGRLWVSEWNSGNVSLHDPRDGSWKKWKLPGERPRCYAVYVDERDAVWLTDFSANAILRFDPKTETFLAFPSDKSGVNVRQLAG